MSKKKVLQIQEEGKGLKFNGVDNYVSVATGGLFNSANITIDFIAISNNTSNIFKPIVCKEYDYGIFEYGSTIQVFDWSVLLRRDSGISINTKKRITVVFENIIVGGTCSFYENGVFVTTVPYKTSYNTNSVFIGANNPPTVTQYFNGNISQVRIWNRILTPTEIENTDIVRTNLLKEFLFNDEEGFVLEDSSPYATNANLTNYSPSDVTIGSTNSWTYKNLQPFTGLKNTILPKLMEYSLGEGLKFNGVNNYIDLGNIANFTVNDSFSISLIFKTNFNNGFNAIYSRGDTGFGIGIFLFNNLLGVFLKQDNSNFIQLVTQINYNELTYIVFTKDNTISVNGCNIYNQSQLDTSNKTEVGVINTFNNSSLPLNIGRYSNFGTFYCNFDLYDLKIFNKALSQAEATEDFESKGQSILPTAINNLVAWYPIQEQEGFDIKDKSPNNLDGVMVNYSIADVTVGINNKRIDEDGNPILRI
jgi:hypothetical protein